MWGLVLFVVSETGLPYVSLAGLELRDAPALAPKCEIEGARHDTGLEEQRELESQREGPS